VAIRRCTKFLEINAVTVASSLSAPEWARFMQFHVSRGVRVELRFAKDLGTIGLTNPANWGSSEITGPGVSPFLLLPDSGQMVLENFSPATAFVTLVFSDSIGG